MTEWTPRSTATLATRIRVGLSLGIALGLGSVGTMALWSTSATVRPGGPIAGQLDVTVNGALAGPANRNGTQTEAAWTMRDMLPGEQQAISVRLGNDGQGNVPVDVRLSAYATGALSPAIRVTVFTGGTPTNTGGSLTAPEASAYRTASCPGGTLLGAPNQTLASTAAAATPLDATKRRLAVSQTQTYCVILSLDDTATTLSSTALRDTKASVFFLARGTQVGVAP